VAGIVHGVGHLACLLIKQRVGLDLASAGGLSFAIHHKVLPEL
jgi:hypothetical protein